MTHLVLIRLHPRKECGMGVRGKEKGVCLYFGGMWASCQSTGLRSSMTKELKDGSSHEDMETGASKTLNSVLRSHAGGNISVLHGRFTDGGHLELCQAMSLGFARAYQHGLDLLLGIVLCWVTYVDSKPSFVEACHNLHPWMSARETFVSLKV